MTRQASSAAIIKNLIILFLSFFAVFALLNTGLSFIYQPLFSFLISVPTFTTIALFALIMTLIMRQLSVVEIPRGTIGLVTYSNGVLKTLAPAGPVWVWFGRERLSGLLSLEPVSVHMPLLRLKSGDGVELAPLVTIITWRIHTTITTLFSSQFRQQVTEVALESQLKRERRVRDTVADVMRRRVAQETLAELEEDMPNILYNTFGQEVIREVNHHLTPMGLKVDRLECIGSITTPGSPPAALHTISAARKKLESLLAAAPAGTPSGAPAQPQVSDLRQHARRAVQEMSATSRALDAYIQAVLTLLQHAQQHLKSRAEMQAVPTAQKALSQRMTTLAAQINALLKTAREIATHQEPTNPASGLTTDELRALCKALEAIEQQPGR